MVRHKHGKGARVNGEQGVKTGQGAHRAAACLPMVRLKQGEDMLVDCEQGVHTWILKRVSTIVPQAFRL
eukprot:1158132-Pelagomonas_calceolata.AAC.5